MKKNLILIGLYMILLFTVIVLANVPPFDQCVLLLYTNGTPITTGSCSFTDNNSVYLYTDMNNEGEGLYCIEINDSFSLGDYWYFVNCTYESWSGSVNSTFTVDNETPCNEDIEEVVGDCINGTRTSSWVDNNFYTCCYVTELEADCSILFSPFNETVIENCSEVPICEENLTINFTCQYDAIPILSNKINVQCEMPSNQTYCCVVNILQNGTLLQTNPEYKKSTNALVSWKVGEEEPRTCFEPSSRLLNAFYTSKNVRTDTPFTMEVICTSNDGTTIKSQHCITPTYDKPDWIINRIIWTKNNVAYILIGLLITLILVLIIASLRKKAMGR